jgi:hypothetical protein
VSLMALVVERSTFGCSRVSEKDFGKDRGRNPQFPIQSRLSGIRKVKDNSGGQRNWTAERLPARARGTEALSQLKGLRAGVHGYAAQAIPQIDPDSPVVAKKATMAKSAIAEKGHFWMETRLYKKPKGRWRSVYDQPDGPGRVIRSKK